MSPGVKLMLRFAVALLLFMSLAGRGFAEEAPAVLEAQPVPAERVVELGLEDVVARALDSNLDIVVERYNPSIKDSELFSATGVFDPTLRAEYSYSESESPQNTQDGLATGAGTTETTTKDLVLSIEGKIPTGADYGISFGREQSRFKQLDTLIDPDPLVAGDEFIGDVSNPGEYNLDLIFSITQPLLKDFWLDANLAEIRIARGERSMSVEDFRKRVIDVIAESQSAYWDLAATLANLRVSEKSLALAQNLLEENRIRLKVGAMARLEVIQAETGVALREEEVITAKGLIGDAEDNLKRLINLPKDTEEWQTRIIPTDRPKIEEMEIDLLTQLTLAFSIRPDYRRALMQIENDAINERFTRNQLLPSLDVNAEGEFRAVDGEFHDAFDDIEDREAPSWLFGATAEYPLGNRTAKGEYRKAQLEKQQSEKEAENLRLSIIVEVNKAVRDIQTNLKRIDVTGKAVELAEESLKAEQKKLEVGVSTSHDVLQFEEELADAERRRILAHLEYQKSLTNLAAATGTLLEENNIVIEEAEEAY